MSEEIKQQGAIIKVANGQLNNKIAKDRLRPGELFWLTKHTDGPTNDYVWSDGELIMGCPEGIEDSSYSVIGGTRVGRAVVFQGNITYESEITDDLFKHARVGDFWRFDRDATEGTFKYYNFHQNDFLMITNVEVNPKTGLSSQINFFRVNNSFSETNATSLLFSDPAFEATTVYDAIMELYDNKWEWGGTLSSSEQIVKELAEGTMHAGTVWYELVDGIIFTEPHGTGALIGKRGDMWLYRGEEDGWARVVTGYTDAEDIDYYADFVQEMISTFTLKHRDDITQLNTVKDAIDFLLQHKAELGIDGKIPIYQLPDVVFNGMRCGGVWNPILSEDGISGTNMNAQAKWPIQTNDGELVTKGTYFIVNIDNLTKNQDSTSINVQYWDKDSFDINEGYTRCIELNTGDWVIFTGYRWEKIDNTDRLSGIKFMLNSKRVSGDLAEDEHTEIITTGTPRIISDNKIGLRQENSDIVIGGIRLIDQSIYDPAKDNFVPRYADGEHNTIRNSHIEDTNVLTTIHQNTSIGTFGQDANISIYGDISLEGTEESRALVYNFENNKTTIRAVPATRDNILLFPNKSGTLATTKDLLVGDGTKGYLPVFTIKKDENDENILALADSSLYYKDSALVDKFYEPIHIDTFADADLYKINFGDILDKYYNAENQKQNIVVDSDIIIGSDTDNRSLHITKILSFGNKDTNNTFIGPGREFIPDSYAYKNYKQITKQDSNGFDIPAWALEDKPKGNVYIGLPADSGTILTSNSPIRGGVYLESDDTVEEYEESVVFRVSDDWENTLGISTHTAVGKDIAYVYKPDQSLNKLDSVAFAGITTAEVAVSTIKAKTDGLLDIIAKEIIHVYKDDARKSIGTIATNILGNAETADVALKLRNRLTIETSENWEAQKQSEYFDGSKDVKHIFYSPNQNVNEDASVKFKSTVTTDLYVNFDPKSADHDIDFRLLKNKTGITDAWIERLGIPNAKQVTVF